MASSDSQREFTEVELAYKSWLIAAKEAASEENTWAALGRLILREVTLSEQRAKAAETAHSPEAARLRQQADELTSGTTSWTKDAGKQLGIWHRRATLGDATPALRKVLVRVVEDLAAPPHDVGEWVSFTEVVRHLTREKQHQQLDAVHKGQERGLDLQAEAISGLLVPGGLTTGSGLDPIELGLGSWAFDGDLPPYVSRPAVDQQLEAAISNRGHHRLPARRGHEAAGGLTVVVGPPKSGKSRTLLEAIRNHAPAAPVWWVNPAPDVVPRLAERAEKYLAGDGGQHAPAKDREGLIIVIDDAQRCGSNPMAGLSEQALAQLARHAHVILTLHEQTITQWTAQIHDRSTPGYTDTTRLTSDAMLTSTQFAGIGATRALIDLLNRARVNVPAQIEVDQLAEFTSVLGTSQRVDRDADGLAQLPPHPLRVAEYFAAVDTLRAKALTARASGGYPAALLDALLDATKLLPGGITPPTLELVTSHHLAMVAPTRLFAQDHYQAALDWATTPIGGPGSHRHPANQHRPCPLPPLRRDRRHPDPRPVDTSPPPPPPRPTPPRSTLRSRPTLRPNRRP